MTIKVFKSKVRLHSFNLPSHCLKGKDCRDFELHASMRSPENQMTVPLKFLLIIHNNVRV